MQDYPTHQPKNSASNAVSCILILILAAFVLVILQSFTDPYDKHKVRATSCLSNLKQQGMAFQMYAQHYDNVLPSAHTWIDEVYPYIKNERVFSCPEAASGTPENCPTIYSYAYNSVLSGEKVTVVPDPIKMPVSYDSTSRLRNRSDPFASLPIPGPHMRGSNVLLLDWHAKHISDAKIKSLQKQVNSFKPKRK